MPTIELGAQFYQSESLPLSAQECVNFYQNIPQAPSTTKKALFPTPGIIEVCTAGTDVVNRGGHNFLGLYYVVNGDVLYRIDETFDSFNEASYSATAVSGATSVPGTAKVMMEDNGAEGGQMVIVCPDVDTQFNAYIYTTGGGLVAISDADFDGPVSSVRFVDGYFLFTKADGQIFFVSALRDGTSYNALDYASAEADPDSIVGSFIIRNNPLIFGSQTIEPFQNVGGSGFPFSRIPGGVQRKGLASKYAVEEINDLCFFLGGAENEIPGMWVTDGGSIEKISTSAIDHAIDGYSAEVIANCFTWKYSESGAQFVAFSFPGEACYVYDYTTKVWHTRESIDSFDQTVPCRIASLVDVYGNIMVGDGLSNKIGILSADTYTEFGENIRRRFVTPQLDNDGNPYFIDSVELVCDTGEGLNASQDMFTSGDHSSLPETGYNPIVSMSVSKNGGRSFSNPINRYAGKIGEYNKRLIWQGVNRVPRESCFKFEMSDPVKWLVRKVEANFT